MVSWLLLGRPLLSLLWMSFAVRSDFGIAFAYSLSGVSRLVRSCNHLKQNIKPRINFVVPRTIQSNDRTMFATTAGNTENYDEKKKGNPLEGLPSPLILGSASFTRKLILKNMGIDYHILVRPIDEKLIGYRDTDSPEELVQAVAQAKMNHLVKEIMAGNCENDLPPVTDDKNPEWIILTADQVVTCQGRILEKPDDLTQAKEFVSQYGKYPCSTVGCVVLTHLPSRTTVSAIHIATVHFLPTLTEENASKLVDDLIEMNEPVLSCAGGLMIEHPLTQQYVDRITDGSVDSVMGLCPETVRRLSRGLHASIR